MNIEDITIKDLRTLAPLIASLKNEQPTANIGTPDQFWKPGAKYFIRTVTHHHTGELVHAGPQEILLRKAAWIADDGRLTEALKNSEFNEVELFPEGSIVAIGRGSIIDAVEVSNLPLSQK